MTRKSGGRLTTHAVHAFAFEPEAAGFCGVRSLVVVRCSTCLTKSGEETFESRYYLSSLYPDQRTPSQWETLVRGHWGGVEIRNHRQRDVLWREDGSRSRNPTLLANLACLRNLLIHILSDAFPRMSMKVVQERLYSDPDECLHILRSA